MSRLIKGLVAVALVGSALAGGTYGWLQWEMGKIKRFDSGSNQPTLSSEAASAELPLEADLPEVLRFLVFSVGSSGLDDGDGARLGIGDGRAAMSDGLTDSLMLLTLQPGSGKMDLLSLPRDLWLEDRGHRINESYNRHGVWALVDDVETLTGLRADHVVSVNFAAFADLTDAVGGVPLWFDYPARDSKAKLDIPTAGCVTLGGADALAFVRSRHWQVERDGGWRSDATSSDWGRIERQQAFLRVVMAKLLDWRLPARVPSLLGVARDNLMLDERLTLARLVSLATEYSRSGVVLNASTYPGRGGVTESGASVIFPDVVAGLELASSMGLPQPAPQPTASGSSATPPVEDLATPPATAGFAPSRDGRGGTRFRGC
jgi:LCP family protein required for cell wall assembly